MHTVHNLILSETNSSTSGDIIGYFVVLVVIIVFRFKISRFVVKYMNLIMGIAVVLPGLVFGEKKNKEMYEQKNQGQKQVSDI